MLIRIGTKIIWTAGLEYVSVSQLKLNAAWLVKRKLKLLGVCFQIQTDISKIKSDGVFSVYLILAQPFAWYNSQHFS